MQALSQLLPEAALRLAVTAGEVANFCDHAEHNEIADLEALRRGGRELRATAIEISLRSGEDAIGLYSRRLRAIEVRNVLWHEDALDGAELASNAATWRALQLVQAAHDKAYHSDVVGLAKADQLRHYALHIAKLAGATAALAQGHGDPTDWLDRRVPDMLLFGIKLATVSGEKLPDEEVPRHVATDRRRDARDARDALAAM